MHIACYAQRFGPRGIGHAGGAFLGLTCDALDLEWQRYPFGARQSLSSVTSTYVSLRLVYVQNDQIKFR